MTRRVQKRAAETRKKIIEAAIRVFAKEGFAKGSIQEIANACDISQAAVLHHFRNKEALFSAVIENIAQHNYQLVAEAFAITDNAYERLVKYFHTNLMWGFRYPEEGQILLLMYYFATLEKGFSQRYLGLLSTARLRLHEILLAGQREKLFRLDTNPARTAEMLHDFLLGLFVNFLTIFKAQGVKQSTMDFQKLENKWKLQISLLTGYKD